MLTGFDNGSLPPCPLWPVLGPYNDDPAMEGFMSANTKNGRFAAVINAVGNTRQPVSIYTLTNTLFYPSVNGWTYKLTDQTSSKNNNERHKIPLCMLHDSNHLPKV